MQILTLFIHHNQFSWSYCKHCKNKNNKYNTDINHNNTYFSRLLSGELDHTMVSEYNTLCCIRSQHI